MVFINGCKVFKLNPIFLLQLHHETHLWDRSVVFVKEKLGFGNKKMLVYFYKAIEKSERSPEGI